MRTVGRPLGWPTDERTRVHLTVADTDRLFRLTIPIRHLRQRGVSCPPIRAGEGVAPFRTPYGGSA